MNIKILFVLFIISSLTACASNARKTAPWQEVSNSEVIICNLSQNTSGILFISRLRKTKTRTNLAPESIISLRASPDTSGTFIVKKLLRRYISSISNYRTLSGLEILINYKEQNGNLVLIPIKKKEYQVSVIGEWPIPKIDIPELVNYFGNSCTVGK